jgi:cell division septum initiation protein DivIVA
MTSPSSDITSLLDMLPEDPFLKPSYDYPGVGGEWPAVVDDFSFVDPYLNSMGEQFSLDMDNDFNIDNELASASSDSGLSSALSQCGEQQLSPLLNSVEEDQGELHGSLSPQNYLDFESFGSPNESLGSVDSPIRSVISSSMGSPAADITEEMDFEPLVSMVEPNDIENSIEINMPIIKQEMPTMEFDTTPKPLAAKQEQTLNIRSATCNGKRNIRQLIRVTPVGSGNPRSILLPMSLKDMKEVRTIKIINATQARNLKGFKINQGSVISKAIPMNIKQEDSSSEKSCQSSDDVSETESPYPRLKLNSEEKRLLQKEGITLPSHYPLTKHEERELKRIRRKIRNKISAQDSRKRKKEYVDGLEDRVKQCTEENMTLLKRIKALQTQNQSLAGQVKRLQALIQKSNKSAQPATCLMVLLLSLALVAVPNLRPHSNNSPNELSREQEQPEKMPPINGRSRSLLFTKQQLDEEFQQCGEELLQEFEGLLDHDYNCPIAQVPPYKRSRSDNNQSTNKYIASMDHVGGTLNQKSDLPDAKLSRKFIDQPLDDVWPPPKPGGAQSAKIVDKLEAITNELKINISDSDGTRTVLLKVPQEQ